MQAISKIFVLFLDTNVSSIEKIKRIIKITIETTLKILQELRQQQEDFQWWKGIKESKEDHLEKRDTFAAINCRSKKQ